MEVEWDEDKNEENFAKHGFDFEQAIQIFDGPIRAKDRRNRAGEGRIHNRRLYAPGWSLLHYLRKARAAE